MDRRCIAGAEGRGAYGAGTIIRWSCRGGWYFVVTIAGAGLFAWVPFTHAARRLRTPARTRQAITYGAATVVLAVLIGVTPTDADGDPVGV